MRFTKRQGGQFMATMAIKFNVGADKMVQGVLHQHEELRWVEDDDEMEQRLAALTRTEVERLTRDALWAKGDDLWATLDDVSVETVEATEARVKQLFPEVA